MLLGCFNKFECNINYELFCFNLLMDVQFDGKFVKISDTFKLFNIVFLLDNVKIKKHHEICWFCAAGARDRIKIGVFLIEHLVLFAIVKQDSTEVMEYTKV